jgi:hypothetical protein
MSRALPKRGCWFYLLALLFPVCLVAATVSFSWTGVLTDSDGKRVAGALVKMQAVSEEREYTASTSSQGEFSFRALDAGSYRLSVQIGAKVWDAASPVVVSGDKPIESSLQITSSGEVVQIPGAASQEVAAPSPIEQPSTQASGGEHLSSAEVSSLPLNARDFSKLLLLAAGTMTDANGQRSAGRYHSFCHGWF